MSNIDTLNAFDDLIMSGTPEGQARAQIKLLCESLDKSLNKVATKDDLLLLEKDLKIFFVYLVGGTILAAIILPIVAHIILKYFGLI